MADVYQKAHKVIIWLGEPPLELSNEELMATQAISAPYINRLRKRERKFVEQLGIVESQDVERRVTKVESVRKRFKHATVLELAILNSCISPDLAQKDLSMGLPNAQR